MAFTLSVLPIKYNGAIEMGPCLQSIMYHCYQKLFTPALYLKGLLTLMEVKTFRLFLRLDPGRGRDMDFVQSPIPCEMHTCHSLKHIVHNFVKF